MGSERLFLLAAIYCGALCEASAFYRHRGGVVVFELRLIDFAPIIEVIQVHCTAVHEAVVGETVGFENAIAGVVVVVVARDGAVALVNGGGAEFYAGLYLDPRLELRVGRPVNTNVVLHRPCVKAQGVDDHRIVPSADAGISGCQLTAGFEGDFQPEAWEVENSEWTSHSGAYKRNYFCHMRFFLCRIPYTGKISSVFFYQCNAKRPVFALH